MFHVEHAPIQVLSADLWRPTHQQMAIWLHKNQWQVPGQLAQL